MRCHIKSDGTGAGTQVLDEQGKPVDMPVSRIEWSLGYNPKQRCHDTRARLFLDFMSIDAEAETEVVMREPGTHYIRRVKKIEFDDGTVWTAPT